MTTQLRGAMLCFSAMVVVGASIPISAQLVGYPLYGGQAIRYLLAALILTILMRVRKVRWMALTAAEALRVIALSALGLVGFNICIVEGADRIDPSLLGAVVGVTPIALAILGPLIQGRRIQPRLVFAAVIVTSGVLLVEGGGTVDPVGLVYAVGALVGEVSFSMLAVPLLRRLGPLRVSVYACWCAVPMLAVLALVSGQPLLAVPTLPETMALIYLAVFLTAIAFVVWYSGLGLLGSSKAGLFAGLIPLSALVVSVLTGTEPLSARAAVGCTVIAAGLLLGLRAGETAADAQGEVVTSSRSSSGSTAA